MTNHRFVPLIHSPQRQFIAGIIFAVAASTAFASETTPTVQSISAPVPQEIPGLFRIQSDGLGFLPGWDDRPDQTTAPTVLGVIAPESFGGGAAVRGNGFWLETRPAESRPVAFPEQPASLLFSILARISHHELPRIRIHFRPTSPDIPAAVVYDGFIQSAARWRVVVPIPENLHGQEAVIFMELLNFDPGENKRTVYVDPIQIVAGTDLRTGAALDDDGPRTPHRGPQPPLGVR